MIILGDVLILRDPFKGPLENIMLGHRDGEWGLDFYHVVNTHSR